MPPLGQPDRRRFEPLWDRVDRNRWKLTGFVLLFVVLAVLAADLVIGLPVVLLLLYGGFRHADSYAELFGPSRVTLQVLSAFIAACAVLWSSVTIMRSEKWLIRRLGATLVPKGVHVPTKSALKDMAVAAGLEVAPALYLLDTPNVNAFVIAARRRRAVIGITQGFVDRLSVDEQRAIFANLVARLCSGDTIVSTGVTAIMWPFSAARDGQVVLNEAIDESLREEAAAVRSESALSGGRSNSGELMLLMLVFGIAFAILGETVAAGNRVAQRRAAEKADAEGMLLLKEPLSMLRALEKTVRLNNTVMKADHAFSQLFYAWPGGDSTDDEDDPEWERIARLREVLGVHGFAWKPEGEIEVDPAAIEAALAPLPPRLG